MLNRSYVNSAGAISWIVVAFDEPHLGYLLTRCNDVYVKVT